MRQNCYFDKPRMIFLLDLPRDSWVLAKKDGENDGEKRTEHDDFLVSVKMATLIWVSSSNSDLFNPQQLSGWWYTYPSEKYEFVSWDDDSIPNCFWKVS